MGDKAGFYLRMGRRTLVFDMHQDNWHIALCGDRKYPFILQACGNIIN
jgi:hypothetical protein